MLVECVCAHKVFPQKNNLDAIVTRNPERNSRALWVIVQGDRKSRKSSCRKSFLKDLLKDPKAKDAALRTVGRVARLAFIPR